MAVAGIIYCYLIVGHLIAFVYGECFDSARYNGTLNETLGGHICQRWDSQYPHEHNRNHPQYFPNDDSVYDAHNYCRDAGGTDELWCYTSNETQRWDYCVSPNDTCTILGQVDNIGCLELPRHKNITHCPNNTIVYTCREAIGENFFFVNLWFHLECYIYACCHYLYTTTFKENPVTTTAFDTSTKGISTTQKTSPISTETSTNGTLSATENVTAMSSCKCWTLSLNMHLFIFIRSLAIYYYKH